MSANLRLVSVPPPSIYVMQRQNMHLLGSAVKEVAGQMVIAGEGFLDEDLSRWSNAIDMLGIQLRAAERLREEIADAIERCREGER